MLIVEYDIYIVIIMNKWDEAEYVKIMLEVDFFPCKEGADARELTRIKCSFICGTSYESMSILNGFIMCKTIE